MLNVELQFKTIAPRTLLNQVTAHLATHQLDAQMDFHVWHTIRQTAQPVQPNNAVQQSRTVLKFHLIIAYACRIHGGLL